MSMEMTKPEYVKIIEQRREVAFQFEEDAIRKHGTRIAWCWGGDTPVPYGRHYDFEFARLVMSGPPSIVPALDSAFIGDEADCVYVEGLLDSMELAGYFTNNVFIVWLGSEDAIRCDLSEQEMTDLLQNGIENSKIAFAARRRGERIRFAGGEVNRVKADAVRRWVERKRALFQIQPSSTGRGVTNSASNESASTHAGLSQRQVALRYVYEGEPISKDNDIAELYGWKPAALYKQFLKVFSPANRHGVLNKKRMLKDIEAVLPQLTAKAMTRASKDMIVLENMIATGSDR